MPTLEPAAPIRWKIAGIGAPLWPRLCSQARNSHVTATNMATAWTILIALAIVIIVAYLNSGARIPRGLRIVPGPKGLPIIGSALELPEYPEKQYMKWAREYGELFQVQLGWHNWVFVNSEEAVKVRRTCSDVGNSG
jgi:hypothetical protein